MFHPFWTLVYGVVIGIGIGMAIYRNNANKFKKLEEKAVAAGKNIHDLLK